MKILYFTQYFPPEIGAAPQRAYSHAKKWVEMGSEVTVITNVPNSPYGEIYKGYKNRLYQEETIDGIRVIRLLTFSSGKKSKILSRFLSSLFYMKMSLIALFLKKPDLVLGSAPYFAGISAYIIAKLRKIALVYELRDPWLQVIKDSLGKLNFVIKFFIRFERKVLNEAEAVVVVGEKMADFIKKEYCLNKKPSVIFNGIIKEDFENITEDIPEEINEKLINKFNIGLIGNLGNQYDFEMISKVALLLKNKNVQFVFVGEGSQKNYILQKINELTLENIAVFDAVSRNQALSILKNCNLSIIPLKKGKIYEIYLPTRLFESLTLEVPVLLCNGSEAEYILNKSNGGIIFNSNYPKQLVENILYYMNNSYKIRLKGKAAKKFILDNFERSIMAKRYIDIFSKLISN